MHDKLKPIEINGELYYTIEQFSLLVDKSIATLRNLTCYSNINNKSKALKYTTLGKQIFILASELTSYRWKFPGRGKLTYTYNEKCEKIFHKDIKV